VASLAPAFGFNLMNALSPTKKVQPFYNKKSQQASNILRGLHADIDLNPILLNDKKSRNEIRDNSTNSAVARANLMQNSANTNGLLRDTLYKNKEMNNQYAANYAQFQNGWGAERAQAEQNAYGMNEANRARKQNFGATAATQLGQGMAEVGKSWNQGKLNNQSMQALGQIYSKFGVDNYDDFLKKVNDLGIKFKG
jgi:hypothetical protein